MAFDRISLSLKQVLRVGGSIALVGAVAAGCGRAVVTAESTGNDSGGLVARGEYLVTVASCNDCHTPLVMGPNGPEPDMSRMLSGHPEGLEVGSAMPTVPAGSDLWLWSPYNTAFVSPMGTAYGINLTPDENTGIGVWTEETFIETLRSGRHWGVARPILPPMPWPSYGQMTDQDLEAVWAYLRSIPPIRNRVPEAVVTLPPPAPETTSS